MGKQPLTTRDLAVRYLDVRRASREHTRLTTRNAWYILASFVDCCPEDPAKIRERHVIKWLGSNNCADSTLATRYGTVRSFTAWASRTGAIKQDPCYGVKGPTRPRRLARALSPDEVARLLDAAPDTRLRLVMSLMACEGMRVSEVARLQLGDIDHRTRRIRVYGKGSKERPVHLSPTTEQALAAYLAERPAPSGYVVRSFYDDRTPVTSQHLGMLVSRLMAEVGVKAYPRDGKSGHAFRHTYCSDLIDAGCTIVETADLAGHADIATTMGYQRNTDLERTRTLVESRPYAAGLQAATG